MIANFFTFCELRDLDSATLPLMARNVLNYLVNMWKSKITLYQTTDAERGVTKKKTCFLQGSNSILQLTCKDFFNFNPVLTPMG